MTDRNCWLQKTPLETGLLLILLIALPFLVILSVIYILSHLMIIANYSVKCSDYCSTRKFDVLPYILDFNPNLSLSKLNQKYEVCPQYVLRNDTTDARYPFIASIIENVYADDKNEQRYLCAAAIITFKWIISSSKCLRSQKPSSSNFDGVFVRAGSNYWAKGGSIHQIRNVVFEDLSELSPIAAIELQTEFPRLPPIRPIMLSKSLHVKNFGFSEMYSWKSDPSLSLKYRKKYEPITSESIIIYKNGECENLSKNETGIFCAFLPTSLIEGSCRHYVGSPVIIDRTLMGMQVEEICNSSTNKPIYLIYDVSRKLGWIQLITKVEIERL